MPSDSVIQQASGASVQNKSMPPPPKQEQRVISDAELQETLELLQENYRLRLLALQKEQEQKKQEEKENLK